MPDTAGFLALFTWAMTEISASQKTAISVSYAGRVGMSLSLCRRFSSRFRVATTATKPQNGVATIGYISNDNATSITITTSNTSAYLCVYFYLNGTDTLTQQQILDTIQALPFS